MALFVVTFFAADDDVVFGAFPAARDGDQMVHGEQLFRELLAAVITKAGPDLLPPPLGRAQLFCLGAFAFDVFGIGKSVKHGLVYHGRRVLIHTL